MVYSAYVYVYSGRLERAGLQSPIQPISTPWWFTTDGNDLISRGIVLLKYCVLLTTHQCLNPAGEAPIKQLSSPDLQ
jgi:hypothetical protein